MFLLSRPWRRPDAFPVLCFCARDETDLHAGAIPIDQPGSEPEAEPRFPLISNVRVEGGPFAGQGGRGPFTAPEPLQNNGSILARVSGGRQQHSTAPPICIPAGPGPGLGFHGHLELRAQECHCC